ncbi:MAG: hypothetical protein C0404_02775 [Verrucomicrobia bacterium]|nr:hypothetical protein [Verrucomicrobiota bacterium]
MAPDELKKEKCTMNAIQVMVDGLMQHIPPWLAAAMLLAAGWLIAIGLRVALSKVLSALKFNGFCEKVGIATFLKKGEVSYTASQLVGMGVYWIVLLITMVLLSELLQVGVLETFSQQISENLTSIIGAFLILVIGFVAVSFVGNFLRTLARNAGMLYGRLLARVTKWIGGIFVVMIAGEQVHLGKTIVGSTFLIILGAVAFGAALAFGLGCKDMARNAMERFISNLKEKHRDGSGGDLEG